MKIEVMPTSIEDVALIHNQSFEDERGFFVEIYRQDIFEEHGLPTNFVQMNHSRSSKDILRGLHFQWEPPMGKMMRVTVGRAFLVAVDIRCDSKTLGKWYGIELSESDRTQLWAPAGFARGFCVLSDFAEIQYLCTGVYNHKAESGIRWDDPDIGIEWPIRNPVVSDKDRGAGTLSEWLARHESNSFRSDAQTLVGA